MMHSITFTCEVITPMFLAGADGQTPELRPASIKGALRFWWRAMHGHLKLEELKNKEGVLFGGIGDDQGKSKVKIRVKCDDFTPSTDEFRTQNFYTYDGNKRRNAGRAFSTNPMFYLGYGVANWVSAENKIMFVRPYIPVGTKFTVNMIVPEDDLVAEIVTTFTTLAQLGGIGSKSRNGYGCFKIINYSLDDAIHEIRSIKLSDLTTNSQLPNFTSFSANISIFETRKKDYANWESAFRELCISYQYARENVEPWHEWNLRELIGLPIIVNDERGDKENFIERHAKPYFLHVTKLKNSYKGEIYVLPYNYLFSNPNVKAEYFISNKSDYISTLNSFNELLSEKLDVITLKQLAG